MLIMHFNTQLEPHDQDHHATFMNEILDINDSIPIPRIGTIY